MSDEQPSEHSNPPPLGGVRVIDFTWIVAGPTCTRLLGDLGAEVFRVENEQTLDSIRFGRPHPNGFDPPDSSGMFNWLDRNKRSITLNARHPDGLNLIKRLIRVSDVLVENYSSRVLENWGLSFEEQRAENPSIIYVSLSGFGHSGHQRDYSTWGPTAQALSGLTAMSGLPDAPEPAGWGYSYLDHMAGFTAAAAITAALRHRRETGQGQWIDLSQVETGMALTGSATLDFTANGRRYRETGHPPGNRAVWPRTAPHNTYPVAGHDNWLMITCASDDQWQAFCEVSDHPHWRTDRRFTTLPARLRHEDELDELIGSWTAGQDGRQLMQRLQAANVPAGVVQNGVDLVLNDPQMASRDWTVTRDHPVIGPHRTDGLQIRFSRTPAHRDRPGPVLGEANDYVFADLLGLDQAEIAELRANGALG